MPERSRNRLAVLAPALLPLAGLAVFATVVGLASNLQAGLWVAVLGLAIAAADPSCATPSCLQRGSNSRGWKTFPMAGACGPMCLRGCIGTHRATAQNERRLLENEERFRRTISALPEGIVLIDATLQIDWCNPVAEQHLGVSLRADQGLRITNLVRDPEFVGYMTSARFDSPLVFQPIARPGLALEVRVVEFELARSILITRDITQRERVDAVRRDFIANVSHELRTPLTVVNGFLETLIDAQSEDGTDAPASFAADA